LIIRCKRAAGKTQLALQLALTAQLDRNKGGLESGVAYFTTLGFLPVKRLTELAVNHPALQECDPKSLTDNVHHCSTTSIPALFSALRVALLQLFKHVENSRGRLKPIRVIVVDSLGSLFHSSDKTTTSTLVERSKNLSGFSLLIHGISSSKQVAVVVINQVTDVFHTESYPSPSPAPNEPDASLELTYKEQSVWFNRAPPSAGLYPQREATMGLIWANQVNTRLMISRTRRRLRSPGDIAASSSNKRRRSSGTEPAIFVPIVSEVLEGGQEEAEAGILIRSLSVLFSTVSSPCTLEFIITKEGIRVTEFRPDNSRISPLPAQLPPEPIVSPSPKEAVIPSALQSQGFISARLTQQNNVSTVDSVKNAEEAGTGDEGGEDFGAFDEEEWASYSFGDSEEKWDVPELEPGNHLTGNTLSEVDEGGNEVLESSDPEENFLSVDILGNNTQP